MKRRRLGTFGRQIVAMTAIIAVVAVVTTVVNAALLARSSIDAARNSAEVLGHAIYHQATQVIRREDRAGIDAALASDPALRSFADAAIGYSPDTLAIAIVGVDGVAIFHSDPTAQGRPVEAATSFDSFAALEPLTQLAHLWLERDTLVLELPFSLDGTAPYGSVRVTVSTLLMWDRLAGPLARNVAVATSAVLLAVLVSTVVAWRALAPVERLRQRLARVDVGDGAPPLRLDTEADADRLADFFEEVGRRLADPRGDAQEPGDDGWLGSVLSGLDDGIIVVGRHGRLISVSPPAEPLLAGETTSEPRTLDDALPPGHPLREIVDEAQRLGAAGPRTLSLGDGDAAEPFVVTAQRLTRRDGGDGVMVRLRDARRVDRVLTQLTYSQKLTALGRLTAGVAHEVKNPLNSIAMHVALLQRGAQDQPELRESLDAMDSELRRLDRVVGTFLDFTRPDDVRFEAVDVRHLLDEVVESVSSRLRTGGVDVEVSVDADVPTLVGSTDLLRRALINLAINACEALPDGGTLSIAARHDAERRQVEIRVADDGVGIAADRLDRLFDLFYTTKARGSGVGLSMVYRVAELHGGSIDVESEEGRGTTFTLTVPELGR